VNKNDHKSIATFWRSGSHYILRVDLLALLHGQFNGIAAEERRRRILCMVPGLKILPGAKPPLDY